MISKIENIYDNFQSLKDGTINNDSVSVSSTPGTIEEPIYDEINDTTTPSEFEQEYKQRLCGILSYIVTNRFRALMLIALVILVVIIFIFVFFLIAPKTSATRTFDRTDCSPNQNSTFFFAYSNDFTADEVWNTWNTISEIFSISSKALFFETYALGRFDMVNNMNQRIETFVSSNSFNGVNDSLLSGLPNSIESIKDPSEGSRVLDIIRVFFDSDVAHCGATLFILTKRFPRETYIDDLVSKLKKYHASVTFVVSKDSYGALSPEPMYRLASVTNGFCIFTEDDKIQETPAWLPFTWPLYLVYSFNAEVTHSGSVTLPVFNAPLFGDYHICMTLQDHGPLDTFRMVHLTWRTGSLNSGSFEETVESHTDFGNTTYTVTGRYRLDAVPYDMTLLYEFQGSINNDSVSGSSTPGTIEEPIYDEIYDDEIYDTTPPSEFEQVDNQRHFGILRYIVTNRFRILMLIALVILFFIIFMLVFFLIAHLDKKHDNVFVCSTLHTYLDTATTTAPKRKTYTAANPSGHTDCSPNQKSTFFFAYSYDLTADEVLNTWNSISVNSLVVFETYALGRFDRVNNLNQCILTFVSSTSHNRINDALLSGLPNSTESVRNPSEGSRVLDIIRVFFDSDVAHCGATLFILTKRLPRDTYIDDLVSKLRNHHAYVTFIVSESSFGGSSPEPMYRLASETNGLCIFTEDDNIQKTPIWLPSIWPLYLVYSFNAKVSSSGTLTLPVFSAPVLGYYFICMTLQNHVNSLVVFETYALGRFDRVNNLNQCILTFVSSTSHNGINDALLNGLPDSTETIKDPSEDSRVLDIIRVFFDSDVAHCGATLFILTKRYPRDTYIDDIVSKLQTNHVYVTFIVSENSFGGLSPEPMYTLASETNGLCIFTEDDNIHQTPTWLSSVWPLHLVYSFNAEVTNSGTLTLPIFNAPLVGSYYICMTLQDHGVLDSFRMVHLEWNNNESSNSGSFKETLESHTDIYGNTTYVRKGPYRLGAFPYNMTLGFEYSDDQTQILQIRIYSASAVDFWVPYND